MFFLVPQGDSLVFSAKDGTRVDMGQKFRLECGCFKHDGDHMDCDFRCGPYKCVHPVGFDVFADSMKDAERFSGVHVNSLPSKPLQLERK